MEDISSTEAKRDGTQLSHAACMRLEDDLNKAEKTEKVTTLNEVDHNLMSAYISEIYFVLLSFKAGHSVYYSYKLGRQNIYN
jgi:hypothetical protein